MSGHARVQRGAHRSVWHHVAAHAAASVVIWLAVVGGAWLYLRRAVAEEYRTGARTITDADSIGLPLVALGLAAAALLLVANLVAAAVLVRRRRRVGRGTGAGA